MSANDKYTKEEDKRFTLRMDAELFKLVEVSAKKDKRSVGRQIEFILEKYFQDDSEV